MAIYCLSPGKGENLPPEFSAGYHIVIIIVIIFLIFMILNLIMILNMIMILIIMLAA